MLLRHVGLGDHARRRDAAVDAVYADGQALTRDQGGAATCDEFAEAVAAALDMADRKGGLTG